MSYLILAFVLGGALGLAFAGSRWLGALGAVVLFVLFPAPFALAVLLIGLAYLAYITFGD